MQQNKQSWFFRHSTAYHPHESRDRAERIRGFCVGAEIHPNDRRKGGTNFGAAVFLRGVQHAVAIPANGDDLGRIEAKEDLFPD